MLMPSPLPPSTTPPKYPFASLRDSLQLWVEDSSEALDEDESDLSFVYSGYAPISIRLIQCLTQRDTLLNRSSEREKGPQVPTTSKSKEGKLQAHPIGGWKGFEDLISSIPGETIDFVQKAGCGNPPAFSEHLHAAFYIVFTHCQLDSENKIRPPSYFL